ncbi:MAG: hypothetical protein M1840_001689 [Geoglossum simile]|nr:MAG: hypothetical protein M1840_001689 [Geoglossum simile]
MASINPAEFGGYNASGDTEFPARCPPDVQPRTRIIAVCGANDYKNNASPKNDGWFFSDFYLFHHLFADIGKFDTHLLSWNTIDTKFFIQGINQIWMTCVNPESLVSEYTEYAHGNCLETRRIVLDQTMLPAILSRGDIRVVPPRLLHERFLATVRSECNIAREQNQSVFLLIFGHGTKSTYGIAIGGERESYQAPLLTINSLKQAIGSRVNVGILLTSCYSGGWVIQPQLNVTAMTAAGPKQESESWSASQSSGRASGSIYASAIAQALFKMEHPLATQFQDTLPPESLQETSSSSFAEFARVIYQTLINDVDSLGIIHDIRFSAQDDAWEMEWRPRSGIPLNQFKERWEMLRGIPVDIADPKTNRTPHAEESHPVASQTDIQLNEGLRGGMAIRGIGRVTQMMAYHYLNSFPGNDHLGGNTHHRRIRDFLAGKGYPQEAESLHPILAYRLHSMELATDYKDYLSFTFPDCTSYDFDAWIRGICLDCRQQGPPGQAAKERLKYFRKVHSCIGDSEIFDSAFSDQGWTYSKPGNYLAAALCNSGLSPSEVEEAVTKLQTLKAARMATLINKIERKGTLEMFFSNTFKKCSTLGKRFRSTSPEKRDPKKSTPSQ